jgi:hypothetical protein
MRQRIGLLTLLVADDDEAIAYDSEKPGVRSWRALCHVRNVPEPDSCTAALPTRPPGPLSRKTFDYIESLLLYFWPRCGQTNLFNACLMLPSDEWGLHGSERLVDRGAH